MSSWSGLLRSATAVSNNHKATIVVIGQDDSSKLNFRVRNTVGSVIDYTTVTTNDETDGSTNIFGIYWLKQPNEALLDKIFGNDYEAVVLCLDWSKNPKQWPEILDNWFKLLQTALKGVPQEKLDKQIERHAKHLQISYSLEPYAYTSRLGLNVVICVENFNPHNGSINAIAFDDGVEYIQQYLRTLCLKYGAGLVFADPTTDLLSFVANELGLTTGTPRPVANVVDNIIIPSGWDSKEKILVTNESFNFDASLAGEVSILDVNAQPNLLLQVSDDKAEPINVSEIIDRASKPRDTSSKLDLAFSVPSISETQDDKEALRNFFSQLITKSNQST